MKKLFTLIASALFAVGASAQIDNPTPVKVTWALTDGTTNSVVSPSAAGTGALTVGEGLEIIEKVASFHDINFMSFQPTDTEDKGDNKYDKAVALNKYIDITFTPNDVFSLSKVSFDIIKVGTGDPAIFVDIIDGAGQTAHLAENAAIEIRRNDDTTNPTVDITQTFEVTTDASDEAVTLRIYVGKLSAEEGKEKQVGLANVVIEGTIKGDNIEAGDGEDDNTGSGDGNTGDNAGDSEGKGELIASWYFDNWSEATVNALKADAAAGYDTGWSDIEKKDATEPTETSKDNCFWAADASVINEAGELVVSGTAIDELKGLIFTSAGDRSLAIAVNYPEAEISSAKQTYAGGSYLWLGSKNIDYFTIPGVPAGSVITIGVESHNNTDARGIELSNAGTNPAAPTTYEKQVWKVPAGETDVDVVVKNTNGCHLYFIEIAEGTADDDNTGEGEGEGDTTGIQQVAAKSGNSVIINLAGQKVDSSYKGIVVKDGKKYVQK